MYVSDTLCAGAKLLGALERELPDAAVKAPGHHQILQQSSCCEAGRRDAPRFVRGRPLGRACFLLSPSACSARADSGCREIAPSDSDIPVLRSMAPPDADAPPVDSSDTEWLYTVLLDGSGARAPAVVQARVLPGPVRRNDARDWEELRIEIGDEQYWVPRHALGPRAKAEEWAAALPCDPGRRALLPVHVASPATAMPPPVARTARAAMPRHPLLEPPMGPDALQPASPLPATNAVAAASAVDAVDAPSANQVKPPYVLPGAYAW
jgi:hypothetical protein